MNDLGAYFEGTLGRHQFLGVDDLDDPVLELCRFHGRQVEA